MSDYISRDDALNALREYPVTKLKTVIRRLPSADVAPIRHGRWINCEWVESGFKFVRCSECKHDDMNSRMYKYCPNCGAKMDKENN